MKERFEGEQGRPLLIEALKKQDIVEHDESLATSLATSGEIVAFQANAEIVVQDDSDNSVYFFISGDANVLVNDRFIGTRSEGTCIGEMAAIDPAAPRSATVRAKTQVVALKIKEPEFRKILEKHPGTYKSLAILLARHLRQRAHFYQPPNPQPVLFIGCSTEALPIANEIQAGFKHDKFDAVTWPNGVFGAGATAVESLYQQADRADFAAFLISADDTVISRENEGRAPRDNVIFELGLFMGRLDPDRVFLISQSGLDVKIPSDLLGITPITYVVKPQGNQAAALAPVCTELRNIITKLGVR